MPKDEQAAEEGQLYNATVRMSNGELGPLVDPGSYGNLVGSSWVEEARRQAFQGLGADVSTRLRSSPFRVGAIPRVDGGVPYRREFGPCVVDPGV